MKKKRFGAEFAFQAVNNSLLFVIMLACLIPVWHVICASFSDPATLNAYQGTILFPLGKMTVEGYKRVFEMDNIRNSYLRTVFYVTSSTAIGMILNCFAAYALSGKKMLLRRPVSFIITFTMLFNGGIVPTYLIIRNMKMLNTIWAIILPACLNVFNIMIMRNSFDGIPDDLLEAADVDGASHFRKLFQIVIPVSKSIIAVVTLYYLIHHWNAWFHTALYVTNRKLFPLQLYLREIVLNDSAALEDEIADANGLTLSRGLVKYCIVVIAIAPMLLIYPFAQKYMIKGALIGSVKG